MDRDTAIGTAAGTTALAAGAAAAMEVQRRRHNARALAGRMLPAAGHFEAAVKAPLSGGERAALKTYSGYAFGMVNEHLRTGRVTDVDPATGRLVDAPHNVGNIRKTISGLDSAFGKSAVANATLFRGTSIERIGGLSPGQVVTDAGVTSTSVSHTEAARFHDHAAKSGRAAMMVIDAKGARGIDMSEFSKFGYEKEVALAPGTKMRVDHVAKRVRSSIFDLKGRDYAFMSVVDDGGVSTARYTAAKVGGDVARFQSALGPRSVAPDVMQAAMRAPSGGGIATSIARASAVATPLAAGAAATIAYKQAVKAGKSEARAALEAAGAGAATAVAPAAVGATAATIAKATSIGSKALGVATRALLPVSVIGHAGAYALAAIQKGESAAGVAKAAAWGAVNGVIPIDLAREAYGMSATPSAATSPGSGSAGQSRVPAGGDAEFAAADAAFRQKWASANKTAAEPAQTGKGEARRGWANPSTQRAAQEARGVEQFSDWAER